jgi:hypothetical protein
MKRRLNPKCLIILLAGIVALSAGVHFLHAAQVRRNAHSLLEQATKYEAADRPADAAATPSRACPARQGGFRLHLRR